MHSITAENNALARTCKFNTFSISLIFWSMPPWPSAYMNFKVRKPDRVQLFWLCRIRIESALFCFYFQHYRLFKKGFMWQPGRHQYSAAFTCRLTLIELDFASPKIPFHIMQFCDTDAVDLSTYDDDGMESGSGSSHRFRSTAFNWPICVERVVLRQTWYYPRRTEQAPFCFICGKRQDCRIQETWLDTRHDV